MIRRSTISTPSINNIRFELLGMLLLAVMFFSFTSIQAQNTERNTNCNNPIVSADLFAANNINTICSGGRTSLRINITGGTAPYRLVINTGTSDSVISNYTLGRNIIVQPGVTTTYTLLSVTDQTGCALTGLSDTTTVYVNAKPSSAIIYNRTNPASICAGNSNILQVRVFGGVSPFNIVYSDGVNNFSVNNYTSRSNIIVSPNDTTTYRLVSVSNSTGSGCSALYSTINTSFAPVLVSSTSQSGNISGNSNVCANTNTSLLSVSGYYGNIQWQVSDSVNGGFQNILNANTVSISVNNLNSTKYYRTAVVNGVCPPAFSAPAQIEVSPLAQSGQISGQSLICSGSSVDLQLNNYTGSVQWQSSLNNITFNNIAGANSAQLSTPMLTDTIYYRAIVSSGVCTSTQTASFRVGVAQKGVWTGADNNDWHNPLNWSCGFIPDSNTHVVITPNAPNGNPIIGAPNAVARDISLPLQAGVEIAEGQTLSLFGNISGSGKVDSRFGKIDLSSTTTIQTISGSIFSNNTIKQLKVSNPNGVSIGAFNGDTIKVTDQITFGTSNSKIITNNNLVLVSNASGTASLSDMTSDGTTTGVYTGNRIIGDVTVERFIPAHAKAWQFLAAPAIGRSINATWQEGNTSGSNVINPGYGIMLSSNNSSALSLGFDVYTPSAPSIKTYNIQTGNWDGISSTFNNIDNAKGYMVFVRGDRSVLSSGQASTATTIRTTGKLYTPIDNPPSTVIVPSGKFESIGNPYASTIDFSKLNKSGGVLDAYYVWDPKLTNNNVSAYGLGGYQTFIGNGNGTYRIIPGGGSYDSINTNTLPGTIQSGQAFFVHSAGVTGTVGFEESSKVNGSALVTRNGALDHAQLGVKLSVVNNNQSVLLDGVVSQFDDAFVNEIDGNDIPKINIGTETISILRSSQQLVAERRKSVVVNDTIFYQLNQLKTKTYVLDIQPMMFEDMAVQALLVDQFTGSSMSINLHQNNLVSFDVVSNTASAAANRFMIVLQGNSVVLPVKIRSVHAERVNAKTNRVEWRVEQEVNIDSYIVERSTDGVKFEMIKTMKAVNASSTGQYAYEDFTAPSVACFYRIKIKEQNGILIYSEVVKVSACQMQGGVTISPNPVVNKIANVRFSNKLNGAYHISIFNASGQQVLSKLISYEGQNNLSLELPLNIQSGAYQMVVMSEDGSKDVTTMIVK